MEQETHSQRAARLSTNFSIDSIIGNIIGHHRPTPHHPTHTTGDSAQAIDLSRPGAHAANPAPEESFVDVVSVDQQQQWPATRISDGYSTGLRKPPGALQDQQRSDNRKLRAKKYQCPYCWVALSNTGQFRGHIRIHTGERPFKCDQASCQKTFTRNEELTRHKRIHTGQRPYACHLCNKRFGRKDHLKKHTRTHEKNASKQHQHHHHHHQPTHLIDGLSAAAAACDSGDAGGAGAGNLQVDQQQTLKSFFISDLPLLYFNCATTNNCSS